MARLPVLLLVALGCRAQDVEGLLRQGLELYQKNDLDQAIEVWKKGLGVAKQDEDELFQGSFSRKSRHRLRRQRRLRQSG